ncbi:M16 family metallopeptidase [Aestuariibaculum sediminum]|uniref:Insulinase family protein n=1 Tax=Aestuariibaculum sediminum TaxID=2770637 RepID=A0A8J6UEC4_9FLAO|nr:insulinase family protein [Aestuariibaculum sediminum]MBD0830626.1 insulinase family protein [Aestuariibaculum sediminum]
MKVSVKHLLFSLSIFLVSAHFFGQNLFMPEGVTYKKLDNGFSYYLLPEDSERGKITVNLISTIGSLVETPEERGVAHFIEHMVFKGSKNYPGNETMKTLDKMGLRIGRDYNASVNSTKTEYHINLPEGNWDYLKQTLLLMKDWVGDLEMGEASFKIEQKVVIEEIRKRHSAISPYLNGTILEGHGGLGTEQQINGITAERVKDFYKKYYTPNQFALVIQGKVNEKKVTRFIEKLFSKIPEALNKTQRNYIDLTKTTVVDSNYVSVISPEIPWLVMAFKFPSYAINSKAAVKNDFVQYLFCKILENRLASYPNTMLSGTKVNTSQILPGTTMFNVRLKGNNSITYTEMLNGFCEVVAEAKANGFNQEEINFFIQEYINNITEKQSDGFMTLAEVEKHFLKGEVPLEKEQQLALLKAIQQNLKPEAFNALLNAFTNYSKTILFDSTLKAWNKDFSESYILNKIDNIDSEEFQLETFKFSEPNSTFVKRNKTNLPDIKLEEVSPKAVLNKKVIGDNLYSLTFNNGLTVLVNKDKEARSQIRLVSKLGLKYLPENESVVFKEAVNLFNNQFNNLSREDSPALLRRYMFTAKSKISENYFEFELRGNNTHLNYENLLKGFHLIIAKENTPDSEDFLHKLKENLSLINFKNTDFNNDLVQRLFGYNQTFKRSFNNAYVYVGGNLPENIDDLIATYIGGISKVEEPNGQGVVLQDFNDLEPKYIEEARGKIQKRASFIFKNKLERNYTLKDQLTADAIAEYGYAQIFETLRKKLGLIYSLGADAYGNRESKTSTVSLRYIADNNNLERCKAVMINEILKPMRSGIISKENVAISKAKVSSKMQLYFYDENVLSNTYLKNALKYGRLLKIDDLEKEIKNIQAKDIQQLMKRLIHWSENNF